MWRPLPLAASGGAISATASQTIDAVTQAASATVTISATASQTIAAVTQSATATVAINATAAQTIAAVTQSATATLPISANGSATIAAVTQAATATLPISATAGQTIDAVTLAATATVSGGAISATANQTIASVTQSATGAVIINATFGKTIDPVTQSATAVATSINATFGVTISNVIQFAAATTGASIPIPDTGGSGNRGGGNRRRNINDDPDAFAELLKEWRARKDAPKSPDIPDAISGVPEATDEPAETFEFLEQVRRVEAAFDRSMVTYEAALVQVERTRLQRAAKAKQAAIWQEEQARQQAMQLAIEWELARLAYEDFLEDEDEIMLLTA